MDPKEEVHLSKDKKESEKQVSEDTAWLDQA